MRSSLSRSPSSILSTGTPVQRDTTPAMSSSVTASFTSRPSASPGSAICFSSAGMTPYFSSAGAGVVAAALRRSPTSRARLVQLLLQLLRLAELVLLRLPVARSSRWSAPSVGQLLLQLAQPVLAMPRRSPSSAPRARSPAASPAVELVQLLRLGVHLHAQPADAASSIRSIALSGRKRSVM